MDWEPLEMATSKSVGHDVPRGMSRIAVGFFWAMIVCGWLTPCGAQEPVEPVEPAPLTRATQEVTNRIFPAGQRTEIKQEKYWLAYVVAVGGFLIIVGLTTIAIRLLAIVAIAASILGGVWFLCASLHNRGITTWEDLISATVVLGVLAGIITISAGLYLHSDPQ